MAPRTRHHVAVDPSFKHRLHAAPFHLSNKLFCCTAVYLRALQVLHRISFSLSQKRINTSVKLQDENRQTKITCTNKGPHGAHFSRVTQKSNIRDRDSLTRVLIHGTSCWCKRFQPRPPRSHLLAARLKTWESRRRAGPAHEPAARCPRRLTGRRHPDPPGGSSAAGAQPHQRPETALGAT